MENNIPNNDLLKNKQSVDTTPVKSTSETIKSNEECAESTIYGEEDSIKAIGKVAEVARVATPTSNVKLIKYLEEGNSFYTTPKFSKKMYEDLPSIIKRACVFSTEREKDMFLNALLSVISGCIFNLKGNYRDDVVYPNLYVFNVAQASSGKGVQKHASEFARVYSEYLVSNPLSSKPIRNLIIPANASIAALMEFLEDNTGIGVINETEADVLANTISQEWGDISTILRNNFHHEPISSIRKLDKKYISLNNTRFSVALSGTFDQYKRIFNSSENGLYSRFAFYGFNQKAFFRNVKPTKGKPTYSKTINQLADEFCKIAHQLNSSECEFSLSDAQWDKLFTKYSDLTEECSTNIGESIRASITRLGLIEYKLAMILSSVRHAENGLKDANILCDDIDFNIAQEITSVYAEHLKCFIGILPVERNKINNHRRYYLFDHLKELGTFELKKALEIGKDLSIGTRSVSEYLKQLVSEEYLKQVVAYGAYTVNEDLLTKIAP